MKHYFITNPAAGKKDNCATLSEAIKLACNEKGVSYEIYETKGVFDATEFVKKTCEANADGEPLRFYACGGDGTLSEVVSGAAEFDFASVGLIPKGTGNDFVRNFKNNELFFDIAAQIDGEETTVDLISCNDTYAINMINIGFDCEVVKRMMKIKRSPLVPSKLAYIFGLAMTFIKKPGVNVKVSVDGKEEENKKLLLMTAANGCFCGGGFHSNPGAFLNDGKLNVLFIKDVKRLRFLKLVPSYKSGTHLVPENDDLLLNISCDSLELTFDGMQSISLDGEIREIDKKLTLGVKRAGLKFVVPKGACLHKTSNVAEEAIV